MGTLPLMFTFGGDTGESRLREGSDPKGFRVCNCFPTVALMKMPDGSCVHWQILIRKKQESVVNS